MIFKRRRFKLVLYGLCLLMLISGVLLLAGHAAAHYYPNDVPAFNFPHGGNTDEWLLLSEYQCPGHCLQTPESDITIFDTTSDFDSLSSQIPITIFRLCRYSGNAPSLIQAGDIPNTQHWSNFLASCDGMPNNSIGYKTIFVNRSLFHTVSYASNYVYLNLYLSVSQNPSNEPIVGTAVSALDTNMLVVPKAENSPGTPYSESDCYTGNGGANYTGCSRYGGPPEYNPFALWANYYSNPPTPTDSFSLSFSPDCDLNTPQVVYLRWYDADASQSGNGTQAFGMSFDLYDKTTGSYVKIAGTTQDINNYGYGADWYKLGGNDSYRQLGFTITPGDKYEWTWHGVSPTNGIQLWSPYSIANNVICGSNNNNNWSLSGHAQGGQTLGSGQTGQAQLWISNAGPSTANFNYKIQGGPSSTGPWNYNDCGNGGVTRQWPGPITSQSLANQTTPPCPNLMAAPSGPNGGPTPGIPFSGLGSGDSTDGPFEINYKFPAGTSPGTQYCLRIDFTNQTGPGQTWANVANETCFTYNPSQSGGNICEQYSLPNSGTDGTGHSYDYQTPGSGQLPNTGGAQLAIKVRVWGNQHAPFSEGGNKPFAVASDNTDTEATYAIYTRNGSSPNPNFYNSSGNTVSMPLGMPFPSTIGGYEGSDRYIAVNWSYSKNGTTHTGSFLQGVQNCFQASCSVNVENDWSQAPDPNDVQAGDQNIQAVVTMQNTGKDALIAGSNPYYFFGNQNQDTVPVIGSSSQGVTSPPGGIGNTLDGQWYGWGGSPPGNTTSGSMTFAITANSLPSLQNLVFTNYYDEPFGNTSLALSSCSHPVNVYAPFVINPQNNGPQGYFENPHLSGINYKGTCAYLESPTGSPAPFNVDSNLSETLSYNGTQVAGNNYTNYNFANSGPTVGDSCPDSNNVYTPPETQPQVGDNYCSTVDVQYTGGYRGPGGPTDIVLPVGPGILTSCQKIYNEPYVSFQGSNVLAGGCFNPKTSSSGSCSAIEGQINTYSYTPNNSSNPWPQGSGVQYGAEALCTIEGLNSTNLRNGVDPVSPEGLAISNNDFSCEPQTNVMPSTLFGGNSGFNNDTSAHWFDYFDNARSASLVASSGCPTTLSNVTAGTANGQCYYESSITLNGGTVPSGTNEAIFVNGNVNITAPIYYGSDPGCSGSNIDPCWTSTKDIPSLYIIAKGNIYINHSISQLDGVYIAQPTYSSSTPPTPSHGIIDTCAASGADITSDKSGQNLYNNCNNQLLINGALMAQQIYLDRSFSSLRFSQGGEYFNATNSAAQQLSRCDVATADDKLTSLGDCAAEIVNYSPEMLLAHPALAPVGGLGSFQFDYITSLSPVL